MRAAKIWHNELCRLETYRAGHLTRSSHINARSNVQIDIVESLPDEVSRSRRDSLCAQLADLVQAHPDKFVRVHSEEPTEANRLYKSAIQYRRRYPHLNLMLRKQGNMFFVWCERQDARSA